VADYQALTCEENALDALNFAQTLIAAFLDVKEHHASLRNITGFRNRPVCPPMNLGLHKTFR
jgi:hypothetical protein